MTLNLILTSRNAVYLSGDFRLTSVTEQDALPDSYDTQKLIPVIRHGWSALIAYMGVASAPPLMNDTGQWIVEQMDSIPRDSSFSEISRRLLKLNAWLGRIRGDRRIAISVVGFPDQRPAMMLISNFLDLQGRITDAGPHLKAYLRRSNHPEVHAVGTFRPDVFERVRLEKLLQASSSRRLVPHLVRQAIAEINASVARRSRDSISEECVTGYLLRSGSAAIGVHGIPENAGCFPGWVRRDLERGGVIGFEPMERQEEKVVPVQWKGMTTTTLNGTIVHVHDIANAGKPLFDGDRQPGHSPIWKSLEADAPADVHIDRLRYVLRHTQKMTTDRQRPAPGEQNRVMVLRGDDAIRAVKYSS